MSFHETPEEKSQVAKAKRDLISAAIVSLVVSLGVAVLAGIGLGRIVGGLQGPRPQAIRFCVSALAGLFGLLGVNRFVADAIEHRSDKIALARLRRLVVENDGEIIDAAHPETAARLERKTKFEGLEKRVDSYGGWPSLIPHCVVTVFAATMIASSVLVPNGSAGDRDARHHQNCQVRSEAYVRTGHGRSDRGPNGGRLSGPLLAGLLEGVPPARACVH